MNRFISKNPDLLIPGIMKERVKRILSFWGWRHGSLEDIDRITAFVTHRCNLKCRYCNGPHLTLHDGDFWKKSKMLKTDLNIKRFERLIENACLLGPVRHLHLTGGEPTLNKNLLEFAKIACEHNILVSITSNGTADPEIYLKLIDAGLTEIRISLDTFSDYFFDSLTGVKGSFDRVVQSIKKIVEYRDRYGKDVFLVINACIGEINLDYIQETIEFLIVLSPNDIKLLIISQEKEKIYSSANMAVIDSLLSRLQEYPPEQFVLLREKIKKLFNPTAIGLCDSETQTKMKNCFIPLTERTIDGTSYYPCSIYLRYYGLPIGSLMDPFIVQRSKILRFVRNHDCRTDPICLEHCTNCCKIFNLEANKCLQADEEEIFTLNSEVSEEKVLTAINNIGQINRVLQNNKPFIIIKPMGMKNCSHIIRLIEKEGIEIKEEFEVKNWQDWAIYLYIKGSQDWTRVKEKIVYDQAYRHFDLPGTALVLKLDTEDFDKIKKVKEIIRKRYLGRRVLVRINGVSKWLRINCVHSADQKDLVYENLVIDWAKNLL